MNDERDKMKMAQNEKHEVGVAASGTSHQYDSSNSSGRSDSDDDEENPFSRIDAAAAAAISRIDAAAAAAIEDSPGTSSSSSSSFDDDESSNSEPLPAARDLLSDPIEDALALAPFGTPLGSNFEIGDVVDAEGAEETIVFHGDPKSPPSEDPNPRSPTSPRRASQEYYDVLEMASTRLRRDAPMRSGSERAVVPSPSEHGSGIYDYDSSGDEAVRKKKKKKKKSKREKRMAPTTNSDDEDDDYGEGLGWKQRDAFASMLFPPPKGTGVGNSPGSERDIDPNDDLPSRWNPASLVTAAQSQRHGKTDERGFYKTMKGRASSAYGKVQSKLKGKGDGMYDDRMPDEEMPDDFNLQSIRKPKRRSQKSKRKDIFWGSESIVTSVEADRESPGSAQDNRGGDNGIDEEEDEDDYNFSPVNEANNHYLMNRHRVEKRRRKRDLRQVVSICLVTAVISGLCFGLLLSWVRNDGNETSSEPPHTLIKPKIDDGVPRSEAPQRPVPLSPVEPVDWDEGSGLQTITIDKLHYIVRQITPDASILSDPVTPQSQALAWAKEDMEAYNVEVEPRVAQRYALMTLYYATGGAGWSAGGEQGMEKVKEDLKWGSGHECDWYGVGCETGEDNIISVSYLDLNSNNLDGVLPNEIGYITSLKQIHLWGNNLVGSIPRTFSKLVNLHTLYLNKNRLDGEMADTFNSLKNMKHLDLSGNRLRGHVPHGLGSLINLRDLRLSNNFFTGTFPTSLISLSNIQHLLLDSNAISGSLPSLVGEMRSLVTIRIHDNDLGGTIPNFADAERLEEAHFDGNYFTGTIPRFGSTRLRELYLRRNALEGGIPDGIGALVKLEIFDASSNELTGSIPSSLSDATTLQFLDLSRNTLTGAIPPEFSNFAGLRELRLDHNHLTGGFPDWFDAMKHLELVHLNNNLLEGPLSLSLGMGDLDDLKEFAIENNDLHGIVGEAMCDLLLDVLTSDCWGLPPRVDCPCCTECF